jgi:hypothetical protein
MQWMRRKLKRRLDCALLVCAVLTGIALSAPVCAGEAEKPAASCPAGDPNVRVRAEIRGIELTHRHADWQGFRMRAHFRIDNASADPVFIYVGSDKYPFPFPSDVLLARTGAQASSCHSFCCDGGGSSQNATEDLRKAVDREKPPADVIRRIEPKKYWEFDRDILFGISNNEFSSRYRNELDEIRREPHVWMRVGLLMWPIDFDPDIFNPAFGKSLQERWRPGRLIIANLMAEPIEITIPVEGPLAPINKKEGDAFLMANKAKEGVMILPNSGGVQYKVLAPGDGPKPVETDTVMVSFVGKLIDGKEFDNKSKQQYRLPIGKLIVPGLKSALLQMTVGSKWEVYIPAEQAYGKKGNGPIEPNATVIFDIELLSIEK